MQVGNELDLVPYPSRIDGHGAIVTDGIDGSHVPVAILPRGSRTQHLVCDVRVAFPHQWA